MKDTKVREDIDLGLTRMEKLVELLGHPESKVPTIHVAGTNGKGSTCAFLASILKYAGFKTGRFQSPAVFDPLEIIQINEKNISEESYYRLYEKAAAFSDALAEEGLEKPTEFEIQTAVAFMYFAQKKCDIAVIEVGLGGDLDATNVVKNTIASVFTPISLDHTAILGDTLSEIADHKSGIMREGIPVFSSPQEPQALEVLKKKAESLECKFIMTKTLKASLICGHCMVFPDEYQGIRLGLPGSYQRDNAALALSVINGLRKQDNPLLLRVPENVWDRAIRLGLESASLPGRFEHISSEPDVYLDGAHNPGAAVRLNEALSRIKPGVPRIFVMGAFSDKDYLKVAETVIHDEMAVITVNAPGKRGEASERLLEKLKEVTDAACAACDTVENALAMAGKLAKGYYMTKKVWPVIICFGSLSWLAAAKNAVISEDYKTSIMC